MARMENLTFSVRPRGFRAFGPTPARVGWFEKRQLQLGMEKRGGERGGGGLPGKVCSGDRMCVAIPYIGFQKQEWAGTDYCFPIFRFSGSLWSR